jgi:hypothetical protein
LIAKEGNETMTNCHALKMIALDGKLRKTNIRDPKQITSRTNYSANQAFFYKHRVLPEIFEI